MAGKVGSPFDKVKYKALLEGLEAVEINFCSLKNVIDFRIESEYFEKRFLNLENIINRNRTESFVKIANFINGRPYNSSSFNSLKGVSVSKIGDVTNKRDINNWEFTDIAEFEKQEGIFLNHGDILMTLTGDPPDIGKVNYIYKPQNATWNQRVAKIELLDRNLVLNNEVLYVILSTYHSRLQLERFAKGIRQRNLGNESLERLRIPKFSETFQKEIEKLVKQAHQNLDYSKTLYQEAETLLLEEIGLNDFQPSQEKVSIKSFSESFGSSGRLDAEYYQPFYEDVEKILKRKGFSLLNDLCSHINYGTVPTSPYTKDESGVPYIKGLNLKNTEIIKSKLDRIINTEDLHDKYYTKRGDIIISQMGTVGDVGVIRGEENWLFASFTIRARLKNFEIFNPYFVGLYIQNIAKKYYLYRNIAQASVRQNTDLPTIRNLYIPNVPIAKQTQIAQKIEKSFALKKESQRLLALAKQAVEVAIEKGEMEGLELIAKIVKENE